MLQKFDECYTEDDLVLDYLFEDVVDEDEDNDENVESTDAGSDMDWLNAL